MVLGGLGYLLVTRRGDGGPSVEDLREEVEALRERVEELEDGGRR